MELHSKFRGVSLHKPSGKFRAAIVFNNKQKHLGLFEDEVEAARSFNRAAIELFGEFASLNDIPDRTDFAPALAAASQVSEPNVIHVSA